MTQTADLLYKMAEFFRSEEFFEKGEDARLELSPDDVRCMNKIIKACRNAISREAVQIELKNCEVVDMYDENDNFVGYYNADIVDSIIRNLPSVKPQIGHWIEKNYLQRGIVYSCSKCGSFVHEKTNFCPDCGVNMSKEPTDLKDII